MTIGGYISFLIITVTVTYSPGPMTIFLMNSGIQYGLKKTLPALFGASTAYFISILIYVFGITHFLKQHPGFIISIQYFGAAYMLYLAYGRIVRTKPIIVFSTAEYSNSFSLYKKGLLTGLLNPKAALLLSVVFPRFLVNSHNFESDCFILGATFLLLQFSSGSCYCYFGQQLRQMLLNGTNQRVINIIVGCIFLVIAILFATINLK